MADSMSDVDMFANRLRKMARHWGKWARRREIECYRVYDRDMPEFPLAIDVYGERIHLQEYETPHPEDEAALRKRRNAVLKTVTDIFACPPEAVAVKQRRRQKGSAQYEKLDARGTPMIVTEGGHRFEVDLDSYLDTGLFIDHRNTRRMVQERAEGKRFLNLFAYTGSFTVYAAAGGAVRSTTVDMSKTYQDWARRNFALNGLDPDRHELICADVFRFLRDAGDAGRQYDLIVMDPPSFSNSKRMETTLDVQRDHVRLIDGAMNLLAADGEMFFSSNRRGLRLDDGLFDRYAIHEISRQTVPEDFRNRNIHRCWLMRHAA